MLPDLIEVAAFIRDLSLFNSLDEAQIEYIAHLFQPLSLPADELILPQGDKADAFFLVMDGQVIISRPISQTETQIDVYVRGDFFGEDSLLKNIPEPADVQSLTPVVLLCLEREQFFELIDQIPLLEDRLLRVIRSHKYLEKMQFEWLNDDEVVYQVQRRHPAYLLVNLLLPGLMDLFGFFLLFIAFFLIISPLVRNTLFIVAAGVLGLGIGWTAWRLLDWGNDFYVITSQRVVWIEKVVGLYDSRVEAPLSTILAVNVTTTLPGRLLGYGNVIVTTYTGKLLLETVGDPTQLASLIAEYLVRSQRDNQRSEINEIQRSVKKILGKEEEPTDVANLTAKTRLHSLEAPDRAADRLQEPGWFDKYFSNIFKTRIENGKVITYRKHWIYLLRKTWIPSLIGFALFGLVLTFDIMYLLGDLEVFSPLWITAVGLLLALLFIFPWWFYQYLDWRNDIYQLTDRTIFDVERKPFGSELKKSALLENILSLEHHRPGIIGYLLNVGYVTINVGETKFIFENVHQPARIQQDIFNRMHMQRLQKQKDEVARERDRILKMIEIYHEEVGKQS